MVEQQGLVSRVGASNPWCGTTIRGSALLASVALVTCFGTSCAGEDVPLPVDASEVEVEVGQCNPFAPDDAPTEGLARAANAFALDLWNEAAPPEGNVALSPASVHLALTLAWAGARGTTATEMERVLYLDREPVQVHDAVAAQLASWNDPCRTSYQLTVANGLFGDREAALQQEYLDLAAEAYRAGVTPVDFQTAPDEACSTINDWIADETRNLVPGLLIPGSLDEDTRMVLTNAVYFKGRWASPFDEAHTRLQPFEVSVDREVEVQTMRLSTSFGYVETDELQLLEMPYEGDDLSMVVLLPRDADGLAALERDLDLDKLESLLAAASDRTVRTALPRFSVDAPQPLELTPALAALGMTTALERFEADFTGIADPTDPAERLFLGNALHKAVVEVNEEGTVATAATALVLPASGCRKLPEPPIFQADHPFMFLIRDTQSGSILFMGRVTDPSVGVQT
jgi:serpin B